MDTCLSSIDRYDDGVVVDYAYMIRMWSALDRSISKFNRECGVLPPRASKIENERDRRSKEPGR
jgi:hypothetical protein